MPEPAKKTMKLKVLDQRAIFSRDNGSTLYEVTAQDENGDEVERLRTFAHLPRGDLREFEMQAYDHPEYGRTWTIKGQEGGLTSRVEEIEKRLDRLEERFTNFAEQIKRRLGDPEPEVHPAQAATGDGMPKGPGFGP